MDIDKLLNEVKQKTWLFTDEQIIAKINELKTIKDYELTELDIVYALYEDKEFLDKEEFDKEIIQYLYVNSLNSKDKIVEIFKKYKSDCYEEYNKAYNNKQLYYHAVFISRNILMNFLSPKPIQSNNEQEDLDDDF